MNPYSPPENNDYPEIKAPDIDVVTLYSYRAGLYILSFVGIALSYIPSKWYIGRTCCQIAVMFAIMDIFVSLLYPYILHLFFKNTTQEDE